MRFARVCILAFTASVAACSAQLGATRDTSAEITAAEDKLVAALKQSDTTALEKLHAKEFEFATGDPGRPPVERSAWLGNIRYGNVRTDSIGYRDLAVVAITPDSATATMWLHWKPIMGGRVVPTDITRIEDTWARRNGEWLVTRRKVLERKRPAALK